MSSQDPRIQLLRYISSSLLPETYAIVVIIESMAFVGQSLKIQATSKLHILAMPPCSTVLFQPFPLPGAKHVQFGPYCCSVDTTHVIET